MRRLAVASSLLLSTAALALGQGKHLEITRNACLKTGNPEAACTELALAVHNVDADEWTDLAAHSQIPEGSDPCTALNATFTRLRQLGASVREGLALQGSATADPAVRQAGARQVTASLGRALHTLQDNCAHHGMPNPQHAWASNSDLCRLTSLSPDVAEGAASCAEGETDLVMTALEAEQDHFAIPPGQLWTGDPLLPTIGRWPSRGGVCGFLDEQRSWDGQERGWDNDYVRDALRDELERGLRGDPTPVVDACALPPETISLKSPVAQSEPYTPVERCELVDAFCFGDPDDSTAPPPWETVLGTVGSGANTGADYVLRNGCGAGTIAVFALGGMLGAVLQGRGARRARRSSRK